ncbi:DNA polymerase III subunit alpha [Alkalihalobacillus sp. MEB130]|uniref:DNA polymerase III subunit alpha n=1 Tax=Alkalihalobacillus sp. MEB130 TaxID=2976704 RepID=UPI0028DECA8F|nr:DNA polymerase III subunit alpha [Alkalihalobacillus sp. MEB130]MDT8859410.1 DNA polymerase III subunit alpha [Alkalihalobacillus sp. MEB130]
MEIVQTHIYSEYSLLSSTNRIEELVKKAKELGYHALALCDHHVMYGAVPFYQACIKYNIKPIFGLEITIESQKGEYSLLRVYAKNHSGYTNLLKLATKMGHKQDKFSSLTKEEATPYFQDVLIVLPFQKSPIETYIQKGQFDQALAWCRSWKGETSSIDWFLEMQMIGVTSTEKYKKVQLFSERSGIKRLASHPTRFIEKQDAISYQVVRAIREGVKAEDYPLGQEERTFYLQAPDEMLERFSEDPVALEETARFKTLCSVQLELGQLKLPSYPVERGNVSDLLKRLCEEGAKHRYGEIREDVRKRLEKELAVINQMGFNDYFLIVWDFMKYAREQKILTGPGRGSAAGSLVAYVLQITDVDPLYYDLIFERFLNHERISMPDIDIDFPDHRRDEVIEYVQRKYGPEHVAQIITFGTLAARAVIRDVGKVLGIDSYVISQLAKEIPSAPGMTLTQALQKNSQLQTLVHDSEELVNLWKIATKLEGLPRHASTHAAGIVISAEPLTNMIALQAGQASISLTQGTMEVVEKVGLLKFDFLGLRNLTLLENIAQLIDIHYGVEIDFSKIPLNNEKAYQLLGSGETTGIFQLESDGMRKVLKQLQPSEFEDIVAVNALYRPGPMEYIPSYIDGKHGRKEVTYVHQDLQPILKKTYGVLIYQEQIMEVAAKMAGFSLAQADLLRRAIGKKKKEELDQQREAFVKGATRNGYTEQVALDVYEMIERFANYGFNRSHAVAYSLISYFLAYLKANYPIAFYTSLLSSVWNNTEKLAQHIHECKDAGYQVLTPSVNKSRVLFSIEDEGIRFGLLPISHVGIQAAKWIVQARNAEPFKDLFHFAVQMNEKIVNKKAIEQLIKAGAMDDFHTDRATLLYSVEDAIRFSAEVNSFQHETEGLFTLDIQAPEYNEMEPLLIQEKLDYEKEALGFYLSGHPIEQYRERLEAKGRVMLQEGTKRKGTIKIAGLLTQVKRIKTKKGESMAFALVTDESASGELVIFPRIWESTKHVMKEGELVFIEAKFDETQGRSQWIVSNVKSLSSLENSYGTLYLRISENHQKSDVLERVRALLLAQDGTTPVILYYEQSKQTKHLSDEYKVEADQSFIEIVKSLLGPQNVILKE